MFARLMRDQRGNVLPIFALSIIPIIGFVGAVVDYSRMAAIRTEMQSALDATALMMSKEVANLTDEQIKAKADAFFKALFTRPEAKSLAVDANLTTNAGMHKITMTVSANVDTSLARVLGQTEVEIGSSAEVVWGMKRVELALALDNTGSMSSNSKMVELKKAAKSLINTLKAAAKKPEDVKIAIVPFDRTVNLGTAYKESEWLDFSTIGSWQWNSSSGNWQWVSGNKDTWQGCVMDREKAYNYDVLDTAPTSTNTTTYFPAADCGSLTTLMPLTNDFTALTNKVDAMAPNGNTNVTIGLVWAWHALTLGVPLSEGSVPATDLDKVIILLTDGENTQNRWWTSSQSSLIDGRTEKACDNIKAAGIKIYTVRVINGNATLLKNCATNPGMYYDVQEASQLNIVFSNIAQNLANLRIAK